MSKLIESYEHLSEQWRNAEDLLKTLALAKAVQVETDNTNFPVLSWCKSPSGPWRLTVFSSLIQDWCPITDSPILCRLAMVSSFEKLWRIYVASVDDFTSEVEQAAFDLENTLKALS